MPGVAVLVEDLRHRFGRTTALAGIDLAVAEGTVLGLLGPNGAGKTTAVRAITTLLRPDAGRIVVAGHDVRRAPHRVRAAIGVSGQDVALDENLTGRQNLQLVARLHGMSRRVARARAGELLERFDVASAAARPVSGWSGGMRRRLDLAAALVGRPAVVVLDEPTTGLDPRGRLATWEMVGELVAEGSTVVLTTQYLEEADRLADTVSVLDGGRVVVTGTPAQLKAMVGGPRLQLVVERAEDLAEAVAALAAAGAGEPVIDPVLRKVAVPVADGAAAMAGVLAHLDGRDVRVLDASMTRPTLDDVFLGLTGSRPHESVGVQV